MTITETSARPRPKWSPDRVIDAIQRRFQQNLPLNPQALASEDPRLLAAGRRYFGSWPRALMAAGTPLQSARAYGPRHGRGYWTQEFIIQKIMEHAQAGHPLHAHAMQTQDNRLVSAATYHFGSWANALVAAGYDAESIRASRRHSCESVVAEIRALIEEQADLRDCAIRKSHRPLYWAAQKYFGGWKQALREARMPAPIHGHP